MRERQLSFYIITDKRGDFFISVGSPCEPTSDSDIGLQAWAALGWGKKKRVDSLRSAELGWGKGSYTGEGGEASD